MKRSLHSPKPTLTRALAIAAVALFFVRHDVWLSGHTALVAGLPISLLYHLGYCFVVSGVLAGFVLRRPSA